MLADLLGGLGRVLLWFRYRVTLTGADAVAAKGRRGILFLPNHPGLIDPVILRTQLQPRFAPRVLADKDQMARPVVGMVVRPFGVIIVPDAAKYGDAVRGEVEAAMRGCVAALKRGENLLFWPAGRIYRSYLEDLGGKSGVEMLLQQAPEARVVLVRTRGLWGSSFSRAQGRKPSVKSILTRILTWVPLNLLFFSPRRRVSVELVEPPDLPRQAADRAALAHYLEAFYNQDAPPNTYVPYTLWEKGGTRVVPEPQAATATADCDSVPAAVRQLVWQQLAERSGKKADDIHPDSLLARDLGLDSLALVDIALWVQKEFGYSVDDAAAWTVAGDVLLAACGTAAAPGSAELKPVPPAWFKPRRGGEDKCFLGGSAPVPPAGCVPPPAPGSVLTATAAGPAVATSPSGVAPRTPAHSQCRHALPRQSVTTQAVASSEDSCIPAGTTIPEVFLNQAARGPGEVVLADQAGGVRSYRDVITGVLVLKPYFERVPEPYVGIMLPASAGAGVVTLAAMFAGKIPVMVNWTVGARNMKHSLELLGVRQVFTARQLLQKLETTVDGLGELRDRFVFLEDIGKEMSLAAKLTAKLASYVSWRSLARAKIADTAVVLFTSGSENLPKAVPLTHTNLLANLRDICQVFAFQPADRLLGMLPPFHSFGINVTTLLPLCARIPVVYHANPTESGMLGRLIAAYKVTLLVGTPTFLGGILRASKDEQLHSLRAVISGAEKCPQQLYDTLAARCPQLTVLEGYGITECSPVVAVNREADPRPGTIGKPLDSVEWAVVNLDGTQRVAPGTSGLLLVRGPSIFGGYLNYDGPAPFVEFEGKSWYRTGDLVTAAADGVLTFAGRLKRFVKLGGEMISLPAIEEVLQRHYVTEKDAEPVLAVESAGEELNPELVLFTVRALERDAVNSRIREAGLSPLHNIRRLVRVESIPTLGTGKTDYRALKATLAKA